MKFDYKEISGGFLAGLSYIKQKTSTKDVGKDVGKDLTDLQKSILKLVELNNKITIPILAKELNTTTRTIERNIEKLKKLHIIKRVGGRKDGYWEMSDQT